MSFGRSWSTCSCKKFATSCAWKPAKRENRINNNTLDPRKHGPDGRATRSTHFFDPKVNGNGKQRIVVDVQSSVVESFSRGHVTDGRRSSRAGFLVDPSQNPVQYPTVLAISGPQEFALIATSVTYSN